MNNQYFKHTVLFWLKDPKNEADRRLFETSLKTFINGSKFVKTKHIGVPANTNREVIDSTYSYCLSLGFSSKEHHDKYQDEEGHKLFLDMCSNLWKKVVVYDSINII